MCHETFRRYSSIWRSRNSAAAVAILARKASNVNKIMDGIGWIEDVIALYQPYSEASCLPISLSIAVSMSPATELFANISRVFP